MRIGILLFAGALAIRLWGLSFGLPYAFSGDEVNKRDAALQLAANHFVHTTNQPSFVYNSLFLVYTGAEAVRDDLTPVDFLYLGRLWMAVLGALTVVAVWALGSLFNSRIGVASALLLAVLPLHTAVSRYIKEDAPLGLMATIAVMGAVAYFREPTQRRLILAGLCVGFAASTKFTGAIFLCPVLLALSVAVYQRSMRLSAGVTGAAVLTCAAAVGFLIVSPVYLVHPGNLTAGLSYQGQYALAGHDGITIDPWSQWWTYYLRTGLIPGMTWPVLAAALAGLVMLLRLPAGWLVTLTAVVIYVVLEQAVAKPAPFAARYLTPMVPLMCVAAGVAVVAVADALRRRWSATAAYAVVAALFLAPPLVTSSLIADEAVHDTRLIAGRWMDENIPTDSRVVIAESLENLPASARWQGPWRVENRDDAGLTASWGGQPAPYFVISSFKFDRFLESPEAVPERTTFYQTVMRDFELVKEFRPRWFTYGKHSPVILIYRPRASAEPVGQVR